MFVWDETDFVACLEAIPEVEEYGVSHRFLVAKDGLRLELTVFRYAGDVFISLYRDEIARPIVDLRLTNCSGAAYDRDEIGEYIDFAPGQVFGDHYQKGYVIPLGLRLRPRPSISLEFFCK